jgi:hypothetical protein
MPPKCRPSVCKSRPPGRKTGYPETERQASVSAHFWRTWWQGPQPNNSGKYDDVNNLTDEELMRIVAASLEKTKQESGKGHVSSTD